MKRNYSIILLFALSLLTACQCVTSIDAPRDVNPTFYSYVYFINAHPEFDEMGIYLNSQPLINQLFYNQNPENYNSIAPGSQNISVTSFNDSIIYNSTLDLTDKQKYTLVTYGVPSRVQTLFFADTISNYSASNSYFRFIDVAPYSPTLIATVKSQYPVINTLIYRSSTKFTPMVAGSYDIEVKEAATDSVLITNRNIQFQSGKVYTFLIKGYYNGFGNKKFQMEILGSNY